MKNEILEQLSFDSVSKKLFDKYKRLLWVSLEKSVPSTVNKWLLSSANFFINCFQ